MLAFSFLFMRPIKYIDDFGTSARGIAHVISGGEALLIPLVAMQEVNCKWL
jgi:hypothetical protein